MDKYYIQASCKTKGQPSKSDGVWPMNDEEVKLHTEGHGAVFTQICYALLYPHKFCDGQNIYQISAYSTSFAVPFTLKIDNKLHKSGGHQWSGHKLPRSDNKLPRSGKKQRTRNDALKAKRIKVENYQVEPPGLFGDRGEHPKMGKYKKPIQPSDITINIGKGESIPECPIPSQSWKEVRHDNTVTWLAYWNDPINGKDFKVIDDNFRLTKCVQIARLYLEADPVCKVRVIVIVDWDRDRFYSPESKGYHNNDNKNTQSRRSEEINGYR
ncbi:DNA topoisomerase 1 alpha-like protein [Tanacetum coccineum]